MDGWVAIGGIAAFAHQECVNLPWHKGHDSKSNPKGKPVKIHLDPLSAEKGQKKTRRIKAPLFEESGVFLRVEVERGSRTKKGRMDSPSKWLKQKASVGEAGR